MKPYVNEGRGDKVGGFPPWQVVDAEGNAVSFEELGYGTRVALGIPQLESVSIVVRQQREKALQPFGLRRKRGWELKQISGNLVFQRLELPKEPLDRLLAAAEFVNVGDQPAGFYGETELLRGSLRPALCCARFGDVVKGCIELNRIEMFGIVLEPASLGNDFRVEIPFPVLVSPTGSADSSHLSVLFLCIEVFRSD
jgi:hypothetical protein